LNSTHCYKALIHPSDDGGYWAEVPTLGGCFTLGKTLDELKTNLNEAITLHLECLKAEGDAIPPSDSDEEFYQIRIAA
jgi:predicted RNase H-like HicB family nuclease